MTQEINQMENLEIMAIILKNSYNFVPNYLFMNCL
jgi:hypothetical protein